MQAKKKGVRLIVTLECTEARAEGATPSRYVTQKVRWMGRLWAQGPFWARAHCTRLPLPVFPEFATTGTPLLSAEQEEHARAHGADEVQQVPAAVRVPGCALLLALPQTALSLVLLQPPGHA
jgi:hypothetical protein